MRNPGQATLQAELEAPGLPKASTRLRADVLTRKGPMCLGFSSAQWEPSPGCVTDDGQVDMTSDNDVDKSPPELHQTREPCQVHNSEPAKLRKSFCYCLACKAPRPALRWIN